MVAHDHFPVHSVDRADGGAGPGGFAFPHHVTAAEKVVIGGVGGVDGRVREGEVVDSRGGERGSGDGHEGE